MRTTLGLLAFALFAASLPRALRAQEAAAAPDAAAAEDPAAKPEAGADAPADGEPAAKSKKKKGPAQRLAPAAMKGATPTGGVVNPNAAQRPPVTATPAPVKGAPTFKGAIPTGGTASKLTKYPAPPGSVDPASVPGSPRMVGAKPVAPPKPPRAGKTPSAEEPEAPH